VGVRPLGFARADNYGCHHSRWVYVVAVTDAERNFLRRVCAADGSATTRTLGELLEHAPSAAEAAEWLDLDDEAPLTRTCTSCQHEKPLSEFRRNKHTADGATTRCKRCLLEADRTR
jgi:hypothetical protein